MAHTPTVHNPTNFEPAHYQVEDYLDNKRPEYFGQGIEAFRAEIAWWEADMARVLGADWRMKAHHCVHCGNGNVRWITAVRHLPTNEVVVFGADCTARLGFEDRKAFKLAQLKAKAEAGHARLRIWKMREAFVAAHPDLATAIQEAQQPIHQGNTFVADVLNKLNQYGSLSDRQVTAVIGSLRRDYEVAARKAQEALEVKGAAPSGRQTVTGQVLTLREQASDFGIVTKMLLKLTNNSRVWLTCPSGSQIDRGDTVTIRATFQPKADDPSFAFGSRPQALDVVKPQQVGQVVAL